METCSTPSGYLGVKLPDLDPLNHLFYDTELSRNYDMQFCNLHLEGHDVQQIAVAKNADGRLELFALGGDHFIYHKWQETPNGDWGDWFFLR